MINREMRKAYVLTYDNSLDEYGQPNKGTPTERPIELTFKLFNHSKVDDIRFNDVTHIALTNDRNINDANKIRIDNNDYSIMFVNADGRLVQLLLKRA